MVKKILFIALLTTAFAFADDGWWIYTYEDVSTLKAVFNYLAMIKTDSGYMGIIQTVLIAGLTFTIIFKFLDIMAIPKYLLSVIGTMLIVFSTTTTVHIVNVKSYNNLNPHIDNYAVVDNVPFIFAVLSSAFSSVGYNSALLIETIFSNVASASDTTQASFLKTGNLGAWKILDALDSISIFTTPDGKEFEKNLNDYLHLCIFKIAYAVDPGLKSEINTNPNPFTYLDPTSSPNEYIRNIGNQKVINSEGSLTTCNSTYNKAKNSLSILSGSGILYDKANKLISKITSNVDNAGSTVAKMMTGSGLASAQANINNYILMTGVRKAFENSWQSYGIGASSAQAGFGAGLAEANLQAQGKVKAKSASSMMPSIHSVLQAVMYVLFPLVLIVQLFAGGFKILQNYILGILWLELWIPSYSVLNYFTLKEAQEQAYDKLVSSTASSGPEGMLTLANQNEIYNTIANQAAIAADMYIVGIPALAGFILFASFQALSGITSGVANVVGQYSNNQTLNQERANLAALDNVNQQMKLNNPLYTGNVGTVQAMIAQEGSISQASKAAASFLASGSNLENFNNLTKGNMFKGLEETTGQVTRQNLLAGSGPMVDGLQTSANTSTIKTSQDNVAAENLMKQAGMLGYKGNSLEEATKYMKDVETNIAKGAMNGKTIEAIKDGGHTTKENTENGVEAKAYDNKGKNIQSNLDNSYKENHDREYSAQTIHNTSNTKKADNIDTADTLISRNNTDTANNIKERKNTTNLDDSFSNMITTKYTDTSTGEQITQYWKDKNRTELMGQEKFGIDKDGELRLTQVWDKEKGWIDVKSSHIGSHITDKSVQEDYSKIFKNNKIHEEQVLENYKKLQDYSNTANYEVGNKNANNYAAAMALQALPIEYQKAVLSNMVAGDTIMESVSKVPGVSALAPTIQSFMADVQAKKAIDDIDGVKDTVGAYTHAVDNLFSKVPAKDAIQETSAIKAEIIGKAISK